MARIGSLAVAKTRTAVFGLFSILLFCSFFEQYQHRLVHSLQIPNKSESKNHSKNRRNFIATIPPITSLLVLNPSGNHRNANANAISLPGFDQQKDRRQKELCLVNMLRLQSWATVLSEKLQDETIDEEAKKTLYLEARLGSKVMVAASKKISGGATANVYMLKGMYVRECLDDLTFYADKGSKRRMDQYKDDLIESIASIVEFDGLETTQDPSPRSSLTLSMYNAQKSLYVQRMLSERVVPLIDDILRLFGPDARAQSELYMREFYPSEIIPTKAKSTEYVVQSDPEATL